MTYAEQKESFEKTNAVNENAILVFKGVPGFDVYNCSVPFMWGGQCYIYGRVEKRNEWASSTARLFKRTGKDEFTLTENSMIYQLEDPFVSKIGDEIVLGGTHVQYNCGKLRGFFCYFYRGMDLEEMRYFTTGPADMKDIRLVQMPDGIGVFSRPRNEAVREKYGSGSVIGFTVIHDLNELSAEVIENAPVVEGLFDKDEWGGCNQLYMLDSGLIGIIGHRSYASTDTDGTNLDVYVNYSFVMDPRTRKALNQKIIGTRLSYPAGGAKKAGLKDCTFTSGIVMRSDGMADLYSGLGDVCEGRTVIDYPFKGFGKISTASILG